MLERCYYEKNHLKYPTYIGCFVCEDWLTFSKFKAWMETQDWEGKCLDKDILFPGNKVYSPDTCVFVSQELNSFLIERSNDRGEYPIGVSSHKQSGKFQARCRVNGKLKNLGLFDTPEKAHMAWLSQKLEMAHTHASNQTDMRIAKAIIQRYIDYRS